jgi:hypothetical protein
METLSDYGNNVTSQAGEDGIIKEIFKRLEIDKGVFCEFGALDGIMFSNSKELADKGWIGLYIEAGRECGKCVENFKDNPRITVLKEYVGEFDAMGKTSKVMEKSFDTICKKSFDKELDFLVIDVDGGDYEIMRGIKKYLPKVLMIECNPFRHPLDETYYGYVIGDVQESLTVMNQLGEKMGYKMLCWTQNIFFIKEEYYHLFDVETDMMEIFKQGFKGYIQRDEAAVGRMIARMGSKRFGEQETDFIKQTHALCVEEMKADGTYTPQII